MMKIGYDKYSVDESLIYSLLIYARDKKLKLIHLQKKDSQFLFYLPVYQRYILKRWDYPYQYIETIGLLKYIFFLSRQHLNFIGVLFFFISIFVSSYLIFDIQIEGTLPEVNKSMMKTLQKENIDLLKPLQSYEKLNDLLLQFKDIYKEKIEYMNIYQTGSVFHIEYTKRRQETVKKDEYRNLYAKEDGMIQSLDVKSGYILVKKNDYVKKGDLLVENTIISTQNKTKIIPVEGHVYAYTFHQYEASLPNKKQDYGEAFYQLLLNIRAQIPTEAVIDKENVLQMTSTRSKITLKMHYTLIEDIAVKGEDNEENLKARNMHNG